MPEVLEEREEREEEPEHGIASAHWNNLGIGWQILCICGWGSSCNLKMKDTGEEFDEHIAEAMKTTGG